MERRPVEKSSMFKSVGYSATTQTLEVEFHSGGVYSYKGVTANDWKELCAAESKGSHFSKNIRGKFPAEKIDEKTKAEV